MWFTEIANTNNPGRDELHTFLDGVINFLGFVLETRKEFAFLWEDDPELEALAQESYRLDVREGAAVLHHAISNIPERVLALHGLVARPARFKYRVLASISDKWEKVRGQFSIREWFKRVVEAIDAILGSLIDAAGGAGGIIKEFKDALSALARTIR